MLTLLIVLGLATLWIAAVVTEPWRAERRRDRWRALPFPHAWRTVVRRRVPIVRTLPADLQQRLRQHMQVFLREKSFIGCRGFAVTDEVRVTIAAQACLLQLNHPGPHYPRLRQILVYPGAFAVDRVHTSAGGVVQDRRTALSGESWSQGQVILSWADTVGGAADPGDGQNVVIHEFAHQLDQETGVANGAPPLAPGQSRVQWSRVLGEAYARLCRQVEAGEPTLMNPYGATDPAEFFAVASEVFFEQPQAMAAAEPALYQALSTFYRVDPTAW